MKWPWQSKTEKRASGSYTDLVVSAMMAEVNGATTTSRGSSALEAGASAISRAFQVAKVDGVPDYVAEVLDPPTLALISRNLIRRGQDIHLIETDSNGRLKLVPVYSWDFVGGYDP